MQIPKSQKDSQVVSLFALWGSASVKVARETLQLTGRRNTDVERTYLTHLNLKIIDVLVIEGFKSFFTLLFSI